MTTADAARGWVLVVEDDADVREALMSVLEDEGYIVCGAGNGREAIERLRRSDLPSVILLDLRMPEMSGWQFRSAQAEDPLLAHIPVVVLSGEAINDQDLRGAGPIECLRKPVDLATLLRTVERYSPALAG